MNEVRGVRYLGFDMGRPHWVTADANPFTASREIIDEVCYDKQMFLEKYAYKIKAIETGWLIVNGSGSLLSYFTVYEGLLAWTLDHNLAVRFARKADAELMADYFPAEEVTRIAEHIWHV